MLFFGLLKILIDIIVRILYNSISWMKSNSLYRFIKAVALYRRFCFRVNYKACTFSTYNKQPTSSTSIYIA